jgi:ADP-heptose:LPS heptosyltransferase
VNPELIARLAEIPGITLHVIQQGAARAKWPPGVGVMSGSSDVMELATLLTSLDLVLSVDSFPAHLAGALGTPVWTLLHTDPDWRWMEDRKDSPWYPTMRLWRQDRPGDWTSVINRVAEELAVLARAHSRRVTH